jgi:hypothetical protein
MDEERCASIGIGAHQLDAALGFAPTGDDDVLEFVVQEFFAGFFPGGVGHFYEIGQHARGFEVGDLAMLDSREEALDGFGGVGAVRQNAFERFLAGADLRELCGIRRGWRLGGRLYCMVFLSRC